MFGKINQPIQNLTQLAGQLQSAKSSLDRIFQVMDEPDEVADVDRNPLWRFDRASQL